MLCCARCEAPNPVTCELPVQIQESDGGWTLAANEQKSLELYPGPRAGLGDTQA